jgi:uncharacterized membrane protein YdjX (TVP38/TMEM64 family)
MALQFASHWEKREGSLEPVTTGSIANPKRRAFTRPVLGIGLVIILGAALVASRPGLLELGSVVRGILAQIREAGAPMFFIAMALLPAVGFPLMPFALTAGPAFAPTLGIPLVIALLTGAVAANVSLSYWLGAKLGEPLLRHLCGRFGWQMPVLKARAAWQLVFLLRSAPGLPFWVQSYALASIRVPFGTYLAVSTFIPAAYLALLVVFGRAAFGANFAMAAESIGCVVLIGALTHSIRHRINFSKSSVD